jgi:hypothetical protein
MTFTGTCYFPSIRSALIYYSDLTTKEIELKIKAGEIYIGKPSIKEGQTIFIKDNRYFIQEN